MNTRALQFSGGVMGVALLTLGGMAIAERPGAETNAVIRADEAPVAVQESFRRVARGTPANRVERHTKPGVTEYEIDFGRDDVHASVTLSEDGEVVELESPVKENELPAGALAALRGAFPGATIKVAESVQVFYFDVEVKTDGKVQEVRVFSTGELQRMDEEDGDDEHEDDGEGE